jgi:hypothetical protein
VNTHLTGKELRMRGWLPRVGKQHEGKIPAIIAANGEQKQEPGRSPRNQLGIYPLDRSLAVNP